MPPVNPDFQVGKHFDEKNLKAPSNADSKFWWHVPDWLAGFWHNVGRVQELSFSNLQTNESYLTNGPVFVAYQEHEVIGLQQDRHGQIWTCVPTPYISKDRMGRFLNVNMIDHVEPVEVSNEQVVLKMLATTLMVDLRTETIVSVSQREALQTYRPVENGKIILLASNRFFDEQGQPKYSRELLSHCRRQADFSEQRFWTSSGTGLTVIDLRKSFDAYLREHKLEDLIPDRSIIAGQH